MSFNNASDEALEEWGRRTGVAPWAATQRAHGAQAIPIHGGHRRSRVSGSHNWPASEVYEVTHVDGARRFILEPSAAGDPFEGRRQYASAAASRAARPNYASTFAPRFMPARAYGRRVRFTHYDRSRPQPTSYQWLQQREHTHQPERVVGFNGGSSRRVQAIPRDFVPVRVGRNTRDWRQVDTHFRRHMRINLPTRERAAPLRHSRTLWGDGHYRSKVRRAHPRDIQGRLAMGPRHTLAAAAAAGTFQTGRTTTDGIPAALVRRINHFAFGPRVDPASLGPILPGSMIPVYIRHPDAYRGFRTAGRMQHVPRGIPRLSALLWNEHWKKRARLRNKRLGRFRRTQGLYVANAHRRRLISFNNRNIRAGRFKYRSRSGALPSIMGQYR